MKKKKANKRTLFILVPLLGLSLFASVFAPGSKTGMNGKVAFEGPYTTQTNYDVDNQKHEAPQNHEPVFMSIFKFIVNCNPFKKETLL